MATSEGDTNALNLLVTSSCINTAVHLKLVFNLCSGPLKYHDISCARRSLLIRSVLNLVTL